MALFEKGSQDVVYSIEDGWVGWLMRGFIGLAVTVAVFAFYGWMQFRGLQDMEAMDCAQLGRQLASGAGYTTKCIRPVDLWYTAKQNYSADQFPDLRHAPLYPAVLAAGFKVIRPSFAIQPRAFLYGPEVKVVVPLGVLFSLGTGLLIFLLGRRLFDKRTGWVAMMIFFVSEAVLSQSVSGTPIPMLTFLVTAACYAALVSSRRREEGAAWVAWFAPLLISAVLCGLAFLTGYAMIVVPAAVMVFLSAGTEYRRGTALLTFLVVFTVVVSPWLIRNRAVTGGFLGLAPYAAVNHSALYEGQSLDETLKPALGNVKVSQALKAKLATNLGRLLDRDVRTLGSGFIICFFLASFFHRFENEEIGRFRWCLALGIGLLLVVAALAGGDFGKRLSVFLPLAILYGVVFFFIVVDRAEFFEAGWDVFLAGVLVAITALPAALKLMGPPPERPYPPYFPPFVAYVGGVLEPSEILCTDIPWATAWYGNRTSILRPTTVEEFDEVRKKMKVGGLYLTTETGNKPYTDALVAGPYRSWLPILDRKLPPGFPFTHGIALPPGSHDQLFLTDRVRWKERPVDKEK